MFLFWGVPNFFFGDSQEADAIHTLLWQIQQTATTHTHTPLTCHPNELRDILQSLPNHKAAGKDGIPSQVLKDLPFRHIKTLAALFQQLANDIDYRAHLWQEAMVTMLPKEAGANTLSKYRPISLMTQLQKLYTRWLLAQCSHIIDSQIAETQSGYRKNRQAAEPLYTIQRTIEIHLEWGHPLTILKIDLQKAFDTVHQSTILTTLQHTPMNPLQALLTFNLSRELIGNKITPQIWGCTPPQDIPLQRGSKQGAPESGAFFILAMQHLMTPLQEQWKHQTMGFPLHPYYLSHLIFVDDLILIAPTPEEIFTMFQQVEAALAKGGLKINRDKTADITSLPKPFYGPATPGTLQRNAPPTFAASSDE